jgi:DNA-binding transcriptional MerR regulator
VSENAADLADEMSVDELARRSGVPVRTIREYQTIGVLPAPAKRGRVGIYRASHLRRLDLVARLQHRGYSLAGIRDLLGSWVAGRDLGEVLGLEPDQLIHVDEPGAPATLDQLVEILPALVPDRLDALIDLGIVERCGPDQFCVPSPSIVQLTSDLLDAGYGPDRVLHVLQSISIAADRVAASAVDLLAERPSGVDDATLVALAERSRGLLAHGVGRLTVHGIGRRLGVGHHDDVSRAIRRHIEEGT